MKKRLILILSLLLVFIGTFIVTKHLSINLLDNDTSGEMLLSKCIYDEKSLTCPDWDYTIEFRINNQLIFAPLFGLFSDWSTVRIIGTVIIQFILAMTFAFFLWADGKDIDTILFGLILLLLPYCVAYGRIVIYYSFYAPYMSFVFLIMGCFFKCIENKSQKVWFFLLFLFSILGCTNGIRQFFITMAPMCALGFWRWIRKGEFRHFFLTLCCAACGVIGLLIHSTIIMKNIHFEMEFAKKILFKGLSETIVVFFNIMRHFGYRSGINKLSFLGFMSLAGIGVMVYAISSSVYGIFADVDEKKMYSKGMLVVQLLMTSFVLLFYEVPFNSRFDYSRYLVPASAWTIPLFCEIFDEKKAQIKKYLFSIVMMIFIGNSVINMIFLLNPHHFSQDFDGLGYSSVDYITKYNDVLKYISDENYELGYAFQAPNVITEKLNGLPVIGVEKSGDRIFYSDWLTRSSLREIRAQKVFLWAYYHETMTFLALPVSESAELVYNYKNELFLFRIHDPEGFKAYLDSQSF